MRRIGALIFPDFELLDMFGPLEMFGLLEDEFEICMVSESAGPVVSNQGPKALAEADYDSETSYDLILVPGGRGTRREIDNPATLAWLRKVRADAELMLGVCTGSALLAQAGLLDGLRATTNKIAFDWVAGLGPEVTWVKQARWVRDGTTFTSSGVSAGIDMSLAVIAHSLGTEKAEQVAVWAEYDWHRDPDWDPFAVIHGLVEDRSGP